MSPSSRHSDPVPEGPVFWHRQSGYFLVDWSSWRCTNRPKAHWWPCQDSESCLKSAVHVSKLHHDATENQPSPSSQTEESEPTASALQNPQAMLAGFLFYTCGLANGAFYRFVCIQGIFALHGSRCDAGRFWRIVCGVLRGRPASAWLSGLDPLLVLTQLPPPNIAFRVALSPHLLELLLALLALMVS